MALTCSVRPPSVSKLARVESKFAEQASKFAEQASKIAEQASTLARIESKFDSKFDTLQSMLGALCEHRLAFMVRPQDSTPRPLHRAC